MNGSANGDIDNGECKMCGECCRSLTENGVFIMPLDKHDLEEMRKIPLFREYLKKNILKVRKSTYDPYYKYEIRAKGFCPFLEEGTNRCKIYNLYRPSICRNYKCSECGG